MHKILASVGGGGGGGDGGLLPAQDFGLWGDNYLTKKKVRVVSLVCDMPSGPPLHSYQILPKYV